MTEVFLLRCLTCSSKKDLVKQVAFVAKVVQLKNLTIPDFENTVEVFVYFVGISVSKEDLHFVVVEDRLETTCQQTGKEGILQISVV